MNDFQFALIVILVAIIIAVQIVKMIWFQPEHTLTIDDTFDRKVKEITEAAAHHVEVNAVLALTEQFKHDPELSKNLAGYSDQVVNAALTHRINSLGVDLKNTDLQLTKSRKGLADYSNPLSAYHSGFVSEIGTLEKLRANLQSQLEQATSQVKDRATV